MRPKPIADILAQLFARRGYARQQATAGYEEAWRAASGEIVARSTRVGLIRRGSLEVHVANSVVMQELTFQKTALLAKLQHLLPDEKLTGLRFKVGPIGND